eukprot:3343165-Alexandrium_andersonii.AAC.1
MSCLGAHAYRGRLALPARCCASRSSPLFAVVASGVLRIHGFPLQGRGGPAARSYVRISRGVERLAFRVCS